MSNDEDFMRRCLKLGRIAMKNGDAPVGSVIVFAGQIIAEGIESLKLKSDPTAHAEIEAVREACRKLETLNLSGTTLYTNVEPCWMCSYSIRQTQIGRIVFGSKNEQTGGATSEFAVLFNDKLKLPNPIIEAAVLEKECEMLLAEFRKRGK
jgi:tRNA(adenine34) deaminase